MTGTWRGKAATGTTEHTGDGAAGTVHGGATGGPVRTAVLLRLLLWGGLPPPPSLSFERVIHLFHPVGGKEGGIRACAAAEQTHTHTALHTPVKPACIPSPTPPHFSLVESPEGLLFIFLFSLLDHMCIGFHNLFKLCFCFSRVVSWRRVLVGLWGRLPVGGKLPGKLRLVAVAVKYSCFLLTDVHFRALLMKL